MNAHQVVGSLILFGIFRFEMKNVESLQVQLMHLHKSSQFNVNLNKHFESSCELLSLNLILMLATCQLCAKTLPFALLEWLS